MRNFPKNVCEGHMSKSCPKCGYDFNPRKSWEKKTGRRRVYDYERIFTMLDEGADKYEIAKTLNIHRGVIYYALKQRDPSSVRPKPKSTQELNTHKPRANEGHVVENLSLPKGAA
jgi:hypothetical protein